MGAFLCPTKVEKMKKENFKAGLRVRVEAFEDIPKMTGEIIEVGEDFISIMRDATEEEPESYAEIYEDQFHLLQKTSLAF